MATSRPASSFHSLPSRSVISKVVSLTKSMPQGVSSPSTIVLTRRVKSLLSISSGEVGLNPRLDAACPMTNAVMESISVTDSVEP